jgi:hypothetical protein
MISCRLLLGWHSCHKLVECPEPAHNLATARCDACHRHRQTQQQCTRANVSPPSGCGLARSLLMQSASGARACAHALGKRGSVVALFASPSLGQAAVNGVPGLRRIAGAPHRLPCGQRARAPAAPWGRHALPLPWSAAPPQPPPIRSVNVLQLVCMSGSDAASSAAHKAFVRYPITGDGSCMFRACAQVRAVVAAVVAVAAVLLCLANPASGSRC